MLGGHSGLDPPLPISNRAVKRTCANDSMLFACESRSLPSYLYTSKPSKEGFDVSTAPFKGVCAWVISNELPIGVFLLIARY